MKNIQDLLKDQNESNFLENQRTIATYILDNFALNEDILSAVMNKNILDTYSVRFIDYNNKYAHIVDHLNTKLLDSGLVIHGVDYSTNQMMVNFISNNNNYSTNFKDKFLLLSSIMKECPYGNGKKIRFYSRDEKNELIFIGYILKLHDSEDYEMKHYPSDFKTRFHEKHLDIFLNKMIKLIDDTKVDN